MDRSVSPHPEGYDNPIGPAFSEPELYATSPAAPLASPIADLDGERSRGFFATRWAPVPATICMILSGLLFMAVILATLFTLDMPAKDTPLIGIREVSVFTLISAILIFLRGLTFLDCRKKDLTRETKELRY